MVTDNGAVILFDEWINVPSRHALMLIDVRNNTLADYSIDQLIAVLGVSRPVVAAHAEQGVWLGGAPALGADGATVHFRSGGHGLELAITDGSLSVTD